MANRLKKVMQPILKQKCSEAFQEGYKKGMWMGFKQKKMAYESEIDCLKKIQFALHRSVPVWIPVAERMPKYFVSVLGYMTDAGDFPAVRECYAIGDDFYFPALHGVHPVSHWMPMPEPPKDE